MYSFCPNSFLLRDITICKRSKIRLFAMFPYFEKLEEELDKGNLEAKIALSDHVHWGYWDDPNDFSVDSGNFNQAARNVSEKILEKAGIKDNQKILDVGCGYGGTIRMLNEAFSNCELVGINIDQKQIRRAEDITKEKNNNKISFIEADALNLPFDDGSVDAVLAVESIFHFDSREKFLKECSRVLRKGGRVVLSDFVPVRPFNTLFNWLESRFRLAGKAYGSLHIDINKSTYLRMARNNGFEIEFEDITKNTLPTYSILKKHFRALGEDSRKFVSATTWIEIPSRLGLLKYLLISLKKNGK